MATRTAAILLISSLAAVSAAAQQPVAASAAAQAQARRQAAAGVVPPAQAPILAPRFLEVGKVYRFILVREELRGEVLAIDPSGWIRVHFRDDDDDVPRVPWLNLYHVTMIVPESAIEPVDD